MAPAPGLIDAAEVLASPSVEVRPWMSWIAIGDSDEVTSEEDAQSLGSELYRKRGTVWVRGNSYYIAVVFGQDEPAANDVEIKEIGIFDAATGGNMGKRWVLGSSVDKDNIDEIPVECIITFVHSSVE